MKNDQLQDLHALLVLRMVPSKVRSEILRDEAIRTRFAHAITKPVELSNLGVVVDRSVLFSALREAADGLSTKPLVDQTGKVLDAKIWFDEKGAGFVEIGGSRVRFPNAVLLSRQPDRRRKVVEQALSQVSLASSNAAVLMGLSTKADFSDDDFMAAMAILSATPEAFAEELNEAIAKRGLAQSDFLPEDIEYWNNLTAPTNGSESLGEYIERELKMERSMRLKRDPVSAFRSLSPTFCSSQLVPQNLLKEIDPDTIARMITGVTGVGDFCCLSGAFEICAQQVDADSRFVKIGDDLLDLLFSDMGKLESHCKLFAATFVITAAHLAIHESLRLKPVYWRRLAAASHAALAERVLSASKVDSESLQNWAFETCGQDFCLSVLRDMAVEPLWRPEWMASGFLVADIFGRAYGALGKLAPETAPATWSERISRANAWIDENGLTLRIFSPNALEGAWRSRSPAISELEAPFADAYRQLSREPTIEHLLRITPLVETFGVPLEAIADVCKVLQLIKAGGDAASDRAVEVALSLSAHISVLARDTHLSNLVAEVWLDRARKGLDRSTLHELVFRLVECAAAGSDPITAHSTLVQRLENLAFMLPSNELVTALASLLEGLQRIDFEMAPLLGRAMHIARLGVSRSAASWVA